MPEHDAQTFTEPLHPMVMARFDDDLPEELPPVSPGVLGSQIFAHQSRHSEDVLNIEVDAPAGVTVRLHVNDGLVHESTVPED